MDQFLRDPNRDTILYVQDIPSSMQKDVLESIQNVETYLKRKIKVLIVTDKKSKATINTKLPKNCTRIVVSTNSVRQLEKALHPYLDSLVAIYCRAESYVPYFHRIIPHVPYLSTPTQESLDWATNKIQMRRRLRTFNPRTNPKYMVVKEVDEKTLQNISRKIGFPLIVKPAGLAASVLVSVCYYEEELEKTLKKSISKLNSVYKKEKGRGVPAVMVEQFMEGRMYSVDIYVNERGTMYATPMVRVITAFDKGRDDFYGYSRRTPTTLKAPKEQKGISVAKEAVEALGLRSLTAHVELMLTDAGWKVIEVGPRVGGFRHDMYKLSYGIDHLMNDTLVRLPMRPVVPRKVQSHTAVIQFYADTEGEISSVTGLAKIKKLDSFVKLNLRTKKGDYAAFARHGGRSVVDLILTNQSRSKLQADIRRSEKAINIEVNKKTKEFIPNIVTEVTTHDISDK